MLLDVKSLSVSIDGSSILDSVSLQLEAGEILGIAGESGSGKTMTALAIAGLLPGAAKRTGGIVIAGNDLTDAGEAAYCRVRGRDIGIVFQEPMTALNPVQTIGKQVAEVARIHKGTGRGEARRMAEEALDKVGLPPSQFSLDRYPHNLSGGQRQRVAIAIATVLKPKLLIADEPTTALDVTTQAEILHLFRCLVQDDGVGLILVTHDLAVIAETADRVAIMNDGMIVEEGAVADVFKSSRDEYTKKLLSDTAHVPARKRTQASSNEPVLEARNLVREYAGSGGWFGTGNPFRAVDDVSLSVFANENVGLVGESGCGKSTLLRTVLGLDPAEAGQIDVFGRRFPSVSKKDMRWLRRKIQVVFQDPYGTFDPRWRVKRLITENLHLSDSPPTAGEARRKVDAMLDQVGLASSDAERFPHEFSGGQRQRIAIARALITEPSIIALDEAVSALDVSIRARILDLLAELSDRLGVSYLFVTHDLSVARAITDRILVMKDGRIVEEGRTEEVFASPTHAYTKTLLAAVPNLERSLAAST
ncbi:MAG: ABC transporter ATP-binding protein [Gammaproteobacteria bacterium]|nr:ABC transporter ATP-binding protein [Gammaproteobacteria bacterium]